MLDTETFTKLVAATIPSYPDPPRTAESIAEELGESRRRVSEAVVRLKEDYPSLPLTSSGQGYRWSRDQVDVRRHARKEVKYVSTRARRSILDGLLEPYQRHCNPGQLARTRQRIEFILDDLNALANRTEANGPVDSAA